MDTTIDVGQSVGAAVARLCQESGLIAAGIDPLSDEEIAEVETREEERRAKRARDLLATGLRIAGVDAKHAELIAHGQLRSDGAYRGTAATFAKVREWLAGPDRVLLLWGDKGRCKSLAASLAVEAELGGAEVRRDGGRECSSVVCETRAKLVASADLCDEGYWLKGGSRSTATPRLTRREVMEGLHLLVIDDFGQEGNRVEATVDALNKILPSRCKAGVRTIVTTNLLCDRREVARRKSAATSKESADAIERSAIWNWCGDRWSLLEARLIEHGTWIYVDGPDLRVVERRER